VKLPRIFHTDIANIHHAVFWLSSFALLSGVLGLFRDRLLAGIFGASRALDIYYAAFRVPDFVYTMMLFFAASTAIIPFFLSVQEKAGKTSDVSSDGGASELFGSLLLFFFIVITALAGLAFLLMPFLIDVLFPGFSSGDRESAVLLSRILLLSPLLLGVSNIFSGITQSFRRFFVYALSPVFYNLGIIFGILVFLPTFGFVGLVWGVVLGAFLHMAIQIPSIVSIGIAPKIRKFWNPDVKKVIMLSLPRTLGLGSTQIALTVFAALASTLAPGSIAIFNLASNLEFLPVTLIGLSYSVAAFPKLAALSLKRAREHFQDHFSIAFRHIVFWALPASVLILVLRAQIVRVILGSGNFSWTDTRLTAASLFILSLAVVFQSLFLLLTRSFYAEGETWRPLAINIVSVVLSIGAAFWLAGALTPGTALAGYFGGALRISDIPDIRVVALPLGVLVGSAFNFLFLFFAFRAVFGRFPVKGSGRSILEIAFSSISGGLDIHIQRDTHTHRETHTK